MSALPQAWCPDITDHPAHPHFVFARQMPHATMRLCPGRHTPSLHRMPGTEPAQPSDPFAGIDENTEADARRPAVS